MRTLAQRLVPHPVLSKLRRNVLYTLPDLADKLTGKQDELVPPKRLIFTGDGDFKAGGDEFLDYFKNLCALSPDASVLDVGSGIGRIARAITGYLSPDGKYQGFDIDATGIDWCNKHYSRRFPNFSFHHADIYNQMYNPKGQTKSSEYRFPYEDKSFDFVFLTSVFTHMRPPDVTNYLSEISRVLKPGGRTFITFFLSNPEAMALVASGKSSLDMRHELDGFITMDPITPEIAISLPEHFVKDIHQQFGLDITAIFQGRWCGREKFLSYQDIVVGEKKHPSSGNR